MHEIPAIVDRAAFQAELDTLRSREKAHIPADHVDVRSKPDPTRPEGRRCAGC